MVTDMVTEHHVSAAGRRVLTARRLREADGAWGIVCADQNLDYMLARLTYPNPLAEEFPSRSDAVARAVRVAAAFEPYLRLRDEGWRQAEANLAALADGAPAPAPVDLEDTRVRDLARRVLEAFDAAYAGLAPPRDLLAELEGLAGGE